jgi:hypothetical protein
VYGKIFASFAFFRGYKVCFRERLRKKSATEPTKGRGKWGEFKPKQLGQSSSLWAALAAGGFFEF